MTDRPELAARLEDLEATVDQLQEENAALNERVDELEAETDQLEADNQQLESKTQQLRDRIADLEDRTNSAEGQAVGAHERLNDLKKQVSTDDAATQTDRPTVHTHETPLEQVCAMPEHIAIDQLSENQQRARHIALNLAEYARRTPNGRVLRAGDLRTVLKARFETGHSETVDRVRTFLDELGGDETEVMEPRTAGFSPSKKAEKRAKGKQLVVDESLARRLTRIEADHDVVTAARV